MRKFATVATLLALVLAACVPALAQSIPGVSEECSSPEDTASQASCVRTVDCAVPPADPADLCFEQPFFAAGYPVVVDEGVVRTGPDSAYFCERGPAPEGALDPLQESVAQDICNTRFGTPLPPGYRDPGQILGLDAPPPLDRADPGFLQYQPDGL